MTQKSFKWLTLAALILFLVSGLPTAVSGGIGGVMNYPRYLPSILRIKYDIYFNPGSAAFCRSRPDRCMDRVNISEFQRIFIGNSFELVRPQAEILVFTSKSSYDYSPPMQHRFYYYIDGYLCSSDGKGIFPSLSCKAVVKNRSKYYFYEGGFGRKRMFVELRYASAMEAL